MEGFLTMAKEGGVHTEKETVAGEEEQRNDRQRG
jgi:hypothetical protein